MPRRARQVFPGLPHHVTQRGNGRRQVFFSDTDRWVYLDWMQEHLQRERVELLAYCLMGNHVHLVVVPPAAKSLERSLGPLHARYARRMNRAHASGGHFWQERFFSAALDEPYLWNALRYVERNPVRAGIVRQAEDYPWSSAQAHCGLRRDPQLTTDPAWVDLLHQVDDWSTWLAPEDRPESLEALRRGSLSGHPCGSEEFVQDLSRRAGVQLAPRPRGRPIKW